MSDQEVKYTMSLQDLLSGKVKDADKAVTHMEGSLHSAGNAASNFGTRMLAAMGVMSVFRDGEEFLHKSVEQFHALEQANAQVEAGLQSTGYAAGIASEELQGMAKNMSEKFMFTRAEITDMQAQLLTFPTITKDTFEQVSQSVIDMATRLHRGTTEMSIMVGKALAMPEKGINRLTRVGVMFSDSQIKLVKQLAHTGHVAEAQKIMLHELQKEYGGSAAAAAAADPMFRYNKAIEATQLSLGSMITTLKAKLAPVLEFVAGAFRDLTGWMEKHKEIVDAVTDVLLPVVGAITGIVLATEAWRLVQMALNIALMANPIGIVITVIAALAGAVMYCWGHFIKFRAVLTGVWFVMKDFFTWIKDVALHTIAGLGEMIHGALTFNVAEMKKGFSDATYIFHSGGIDIAKSFKKGYDEGMAGFEADHPKTVAGPKTIAKQGKAGPAGQDGKTESAKAEGQKNVNIHVTINGGLVPKIEYHVTNINESLKNMKERIAEALTSAVNDSQIVAGQ